MIHCGKCGKKLEVADFGKGKQTKCVRCGVNVPVPSARPSAPQLRLFCAQCGGRLAAPVEHAGEEMICPSCRLTVALPFLESAGQDAGDTQPLLPVVNKGDTDTLPVPTVKSAAEAAPVPEPAASPPDSGIADRETRAIEIEHPPEEAAAPPPAAPKSAAAGNGTPKPSAESAEGAKGDTRPVASGAPPHPETRRITGETPVEAGDESAIEVSDDDIVELKDSRSRWMDGLLDQFVEKHSGEWKTGDLIELSERLSRAGYRYLDIVALNAQLQQKKEAYNTKSARNLKTLREKDLIKKFVDDHQGRWSDKDLGDLVKEIKAGNLWPVKLPLLNKLLEEHRQPWKIKMAANLKRLVKDGILKEYIDSRRGGWTQEGWQDLMKQLEKRGYFPNDPTAVAMALRRELTACARGNLARLQKDGILSTFVAEHKGNWTREDLQQLLRRIEKEGYAPVVSLGAALDAERERWAGQNGTPPDP